MRFSSGVALLVAVGAVATSDPAVAQDSPAHRHMGHVLDGFRGTPEGVGLLPAAGEEAAVAATHAGLATRNPDNLGSIQRHIGHVLNAVDPTVEESGPGKGYGLLKAAQGVATHVRLAADSEGASQNVKTHAAHVGASAGNVVMWAERILELGSQVKEAETAGAAAEMAQEIQMLTQAIVDGQDANEDGRIGWGEGEGGLAQAVQHMNLMKRGEGMD